MTSEDGIIRAVAPLGVAMNVRPSRECQPLVFARACQGVGSCTTFRAGRNKDRATREMLLLLKLPKNCKSISFYSCTNFVTFDAFVGDVAACALCVWWSSRKRARAPRAAVAPATRDPRMAVLGWQFKWQCDDLTNVANST